ncbi:AAA family ATPase [Streptomyces sp. Lzd4kr]|nr:AAA family ATPase [Streptomyces sp. Lzd4kr]
MAYTDEGTPRTQGAPSQNNESTPSVNPVDEWAGVPDGERLAEELAYDVYKERARDERLRIGARARADDHEERELAKRLLADRQLAALKSPEGRAELAAMFGAGVLTGDQLDEMLDPVMLIDGVQCVGSLVRTFGNPKTYKSFIVLHKAACVSLGIPWYGHSTARTNVLYVVAEGTAGMKKRKRAWEARHGGRKMAVRFYPKAVQIGDPEQMRALIAYCVVHDIGFVIYDTQARCTVGHDENSNTEMGVIIAALDVLRAETGACTELVHHAGAEGVRGRGATALDGAVDTEFKTERTGKSATVKLVTRFQKDMEEGPDIELVVSKIGDSMVLELADTSSTSVERLPTLTDLQLRVLRAVEEYGEAGASPTDLARDCGKSRGHMQKTAEALRKKSLVQHKARRYSVIGEGWHVLNEAAQEQAREAAQSSAQTLPEAGDDMGDES